MKEVDVLPILSDNYVFVLRHDHQALVVDPGDAPPVLAHLMKHQLQLTGILITHRHSDHIDGVIELAEHTSAPIWAPAADQGQLPFDFMGLREGNVLELAGFRFEIWELPGHTLDHIAFYEKDKGWMFSGDVLFGMSCGRIFEGTLHQTHESLQRLLSLPDSTKVFCTHEYTMVNLDFALERSPQPGLDSYAKEQEQRLRQEGKTIPLLMEEQRRWNPFLTPDFEVFKSLRQQRNQYRGKAR